MSVSRHADGLRSWAAESDVRLLLVTLAGLYLLFSLVSLVLGLDLNGTVNTLRRITFLSALYAMLVLALNLQWGYAGLFNIGVAGFMAIGVYTMGILSTSPEATFPGLGLPLPIGILGGVLAAAAAGVVASVPALRLRGDYLAIVTLAFSEIIRLSIRSPITQEFTIGGITLGTGGARGLALPDNPVHAFFGTPPGEAAVDLFGLVGITEPVVVGWGYVLVLLLVLGGVYWLMLRIGYSPFGRVLKAIREDEVVATSLGKDTRWYKIKVFAVGCAIMGLAAILWRLSGGYVSTGSFRPIQTFYIFVALIIGGAGSNTGSVIGGAVFASLLFEGPNYVRRVVVELFEVSDAPNTFGQALAALGGLDVGPLVAYTFSDVNVAALRLVLLGVVLVLLMHRRPEGLLGHRKEVAASVDLSERSGEGDR